MSEIASLGPRVLPRAATDQGLPERATRMRITAEDVYLRSHPMGLTEGMLYKGDAFIAVHINKGWAYGYAEGHADQPGWIQFGHPNGKNNAQAVGTAPVPDELKGVHMDRHKAGGVNYVRGGERMPLPWDLSFPATVTADSMRLYANYDSKNGPADRTIDLPRGTEVGVRYLADDKWAMIQVKSTVSPDGTPKWLFARLDDLKIWDEKTAMALFKDGKNVPKDYRHPGPTA